MLSYEPGKVINLQPGMAETLYEQGGRGGADYQAAPANAPPQVFAYAITPDTEVKGEIKPGTRVLIRYTQMGRGDSATKTAVSIDAVWEK